MDRKSNKNVPDNDMIYPLGIHRSCCIEVLAICYLFILEYLSSSTNGMSWGIPGEGKAPLRARL